MLWESNNSKLSYAAEALPKDEQEEQVVNEPGTTFCYWIIFFRIPRTRSSYKPFVNHNQHHLKYLNGFQSYMAFLSVRF